MGNNFGKRLPYGRFLVYNSLNPRKIVLWRAAATDMRRVGHRQPYTVTEVAELAFLNSRCFLDRMMSKLGPVVGSSHRIFYSSTSYMCLGLAALTLEHLFLPRVFIDGKIMTNYFSKVLLELSVSGSSILAGK